MMGTVTLIPPSFPFATIPDPPFASLACLSRAHFLLRASTNAKRPLNSQL
jgi:hypothetical protein